MLLAFVGFGVVFLFVITLIMVIEAIWRDRRKETAWRREASRLVEAHRAEEQEARLRAEEEGLRAIEEIFAMVAPEARRKAEDAARAPDEAGAIADASARQRADDESLREAEKARVAAEQQARAHEHA